MLWAGEGTYLTMAASNYALKRNEERKSAMGYFNGVFFSIFQLNQVMGNLLSSFLLAAIKVESKILMYVFFGIGIASTISLIILPQEKNEGGVEEKEKVESLGKKAGKALVLLKDTKMIFLIPVLLYSGMQTAILIGDFTKNVITPTLGVTHIGYVMTGFGVVDVISSYIFGKVSDKAGSSPLVICGFLSQYLFLVGYLLFILINENWKNFIISNPYVLFITVAMYGIGDAVWNTLPNILLSRFFTDNTEGAFSNLKFWQSLGTFIPFLWGPFLDIKIKLFIGSCVLLIAVISMIILDRRVKPLDDYKEIVIN